MSKLALFGGPRAVDRELQPYPSMSEAEMAAVMRVMRSGRLSGFYGTWSDQFFGGPEVQAFESEWCARFGVRHAVTVNSATSGLVAALGAARVTPGSEVIVPPYTMSATAVAPLFYGGIPVFADIEKDTFTLDVGAVEKAIGPNTKAIVAVNLFGHPARLHELRRLADARGIVLIEDNAQAILTMEDDRLSWTIGHIGVFSLNYHKHVHTGEGGVCTTDDPDLARRMQMIRNHAENIVEPTGVTDLTNLVGHNFRMTELSAAIGRAQLAAIDDHVGRRMRAGAALSERVSGLDGLVVPPIREKCTHAYYIWALRVERAKLGVDRATFAKALAAEGFPVALGYVRPLYLLPLFQKRIAFGSYPFNLTDRTYPRGLCPVVERMHEEELLGFELCVEDVDEARARILGDAIRKVHAHRSELAQ